MTPRIIEVRINTIAESYLEKRNLTKQYLKACEYIVDGNTKNTGLKLREPKSHEIWYFRINKQYRAFCKLV